MKNRIVVTATGQASAPPDRASLTIGASLVRADPGSALAAIGEKAARVSERLQELGVAREAMQTSDLSLWAESDRDGAPAGYRVRNSLHVDIDDIEKVGSVLAAALETIGEGAEMHGISFSLRNQEAVTNEAREKAFVAARAKAQQLATLAGRSLGPVVAMNESVGGSERPSPLARVAMAESMPVEVGAASVTVSLTVQFALVG